MSGFVIGTIEITDPESFGGYAAQVGAVIENGGGRVLAMGPVVDVLEGDGEPSAAVVIGFESAEAANAWYHSLEYVAIRGLRQLSGRTSVLLVDAAAAS